MATLRKVPSGRWEVIVYLRKHPDTGKDRKQSRTFVSRKEGEAWATKIEGLRNDGVYRPTVSKATFASYLRDTWLPMYSTQVRSIYTPEKVLGKWIINATPELDVPLLGGKKLSRLGVSDFNRFYVALADNHEMDYRGIQHLHALLRRALKHAVRSGELPTNPTDFAVLPKPDVNAEITCEADEDDAGEVHYLSLEQAKRFREAALIDRHSALWLLLLDAGLRPGEAFALQWRRVDFERNLVKVRGTLARVRGEQRKEKRRGWMITKPKTKASIGDVPVRRETIEALRHLKVDQNKWRLQLGAEWQDHGFVFATETGTPLGNNFGRAWECVLRAADDRAGDLGTWGEEPAKPKSGPTPTRSFTPRFSPYVLRHTCATLLLLLGVDLLTVSRRLRHKNIAITARFYGHIKAKDTTAAPEAFDRLFAASSA